MTEKPLITQLKETSLLSEDEIAAIAPSLNGGPGQEAVEILTRTVLEMKARLEEARENSLTDPLTGLPNRRALSVALDQRLEDVRRYPDEISAALVYFDLNKFKPINDECGHRNGDIVLQAIARQLKETLRDNDMVARIGGDEFAILAWGKGGLDTNEIKQKIQSIFEGFVFEHESKKYPVGASIGLVEINPETLKQYNILMAKLFWMKPMIACMRRRKVGPEPEAMP